MKNKGKRAYRFIEKTLGKGPSLEAAPNAKYTGDEVQSVIIFAAATQRTPEAAVTVLRDRDKEAPSPDVVHRRLREASTGDLVEQFTPCLEEVFKEAKTRRLFSTPKRVAIDIHEKPFQRRSRGNRKGQGEAGHHHLLGVYKPRRASGGLQVHVSSPAPDG